MNENDLRVIKTLENIETTFLELLDKKSFSQITIVELISTCRISKGTFYYHYKNKYDLAEKLLKKQLAIYDEIFAHNQQAELHSISNIKKPYQVSRYLAEIIIAEAEMLSTGEAEAGPDFFETIQELTYFINCLQT